MHALAAFVFHDGIVNEKERACANQVRIHSRWRRRAGRWLAPGGGGHKLEAIIVNGKTVVPCVLVNLNLIDVLERRGARGRKRPTRVSCQRDAVVGPYTIVGFVTHRLVATSPAGRLQDDDGLVTLEARPIRIVGEGPENEVRVCARIPMRRRGRRIANARVEPALRHETEGARADPHARRVITDPHGRIVRGESAPRRGVVFGKFRAATIENKPATGHKHGKEKLATRPRHNQALILHFLRPQATFVTRP